MQSTIDRYEERLKSDKEDAQKILEEKTMTGLLFSKESSIKKKAFNISRHFIHNLSHSLLFALSSLFTTQVHSSALMESLKYCLFGSMKIPFPSPNKIPFSHELLCPIPVSKPSFACVSRKNERRLRISHRPFQIYKSYSLSILLQAL